MNWEEEAAVHVCVLAYSAICVTVFEEGGYYSERGLNEKKLKR